jgi:hypothetical protein
MQAVVETTGGLFPPHTYLLEGNNLVAYIRAGHTDPFYFKNPIKGFDKRGRKFKETTATPFNDWAKLLKAHIDVAEPIAVTRQVVGSKGEIYTVDLDAKTCTCAGFTFRGSCKHTKDL